eukprot:UN23569
MGRVQVITHHSPEIEEVSCERGNGLLASTCKMWIEEKLVRYNCGSTDWMGGWWIEKTATHIVFARVRQKAACNFRKAMCKFLPLITCKTLKIPWKWYGI